MKRECRKEGCLKNIQLEEHHILPKFMDNKIGKNPEGYPSRINLCFIHHKVLHKIIIIPTLKKYSSMPEYNHEFYLWKHTLQNKKEECINEVIEKTITYIENKYDTNTKTTTA